MKINEHGYWENETDEGHGIDPQILIGLFGFFDVEYHKKGYELRILDVGCGDGYYTFHLNADKRFYCEGYDGNPFTPEISGGIGRVADFATTQYLGLFDCVLSLEVGEHIPAKYEDVFLDNLARHAARCIVLSWAILGQGGDGHVNCRNNDYIIEKMDKLGFYIDWPDTKGLRHSASPYPNPGYWFRNTLMIFRRKSDWDRSTGA